MVAGDPACEHNSPTLPRSCRRATDHHMSKSAPLTFKSALAFWWKLGWISFGGPAGQISIMHQEIVDRKRWMDESQFLHALNFCMLLPGPEAQQLATYLGWRLHGIRGGLAAGFLFIFPSVLILMALAWVYMAFGDVPSIQGIFHGLEPAVIAIVAAAVIKIGSKSLRSVTLWTIAALAFAGIFWLKISFVFIIFGAALIGLVGARFVPSQFPVKSAGAGVENDQHDGTYAALPAVPKPTLGRNLKVIIFGVLLWLVPLLVVGGIMGWQGVHFQEGLFFSKAAMITFGGAYAVLPYVAQQAVDTHGWLTNTEMLAGLGLAETTPGPLVIVLQFVGFAGGWNHPPTGWTQGGSAVLGAFITVWATFVPCFVFIFLGGPYVEGLREKKGIATALSAITAAVVGVILNLAVVFAMVSLHPQVGEWDYFTAVLSVLAFVALVRFKLDLIPVLLCCAGAGWVWGLAGM